MPIVKKERVWYSGAWRTPSGVEKRKERYKTDPKYRELVLEKNREKYIKHRDKEIERKRKYRESNREKVNEGQREYYKENKTRILGLVKAGRIKRNPMHGYTSLIHQLKTGELEFPEFTKRVGNIITHLSEKITEGE